MSAEQRRARAYAARALIEDPTLVQGFDEIEQDLITEWAKPASFDDPRAISRREGIYVELQAMRKLRQKLASFAAGSRD